MIDWIEQDAAAIRRRARRVGIATAVTLIVFGSICIAAHFIGKFW